MTAWKKHKVSPERIKLWTDYNTLKYRRTNAIRLFRLAYLRKAAVKKSRGYFFDTYVINNLIFLNVHGLRERINGDYINLNDSFIPLTRIKTVDII